MVGLWYRIGLRVRRYLFNYTYLLFVTYNKWIFNTMTMFIFGYSLFVGQRFTCALAFFLHRGQGAAIILYNFYKGEYHVCGRRLAI